MKIGILAIQGDYEAHAKMLERIGVAYVFVRTPNDLSGLNGLILPGGESTTHLKVITEEGLLPAIQNFAKQGGAFFGTCAGAILLAKEVHRPRSGLSRPPRYVRPTQRLRTPASQRSPHGRFQTHRSPHRNGLHPSPNNRQSRLRCRNPGRKRRPSSNGPPRPHPGRNLPPRINHRSNRPQIFS